MKRQLLWIIVSFLVALSLVLASCAKEAEEEEEEEEIVVEEEEEEEEEEEGPPIVGNWWDNLGEPEYGGTIVVREATLNLDLDPENSWGGQYSYYGDFLWIHDWTLDREIYPFLISFVPDKYWVGCQVESWEMPDMQTVVVHLREGIRWQDKPPLNGREFTAHDVQHHYDRMLGTGSGYTQPSPFQIGRMGILEKVTATDTHTFTIKFDYPTAWGIYTCFEMAGQNWIEAPEMVTLEEGFTDWKHGVGTGPWILTDFVSGSSATYAKNPDYWGYDERHPENQLPYADKFKQLVIPDIATAMAALRTGKVDVMTGLDWEQAASMKRTNPELKQASLPRPGQNPELRVDREHFTDINVRKALQMAIDRKTIAETLFGGTVDGLPCGIISPAAKGYNFAYEDWPQELKDEYSYNPTRARELLAEAGYPDGFKTNIIVGSGDDLALVEIVKNYFMDIGVDMELRVMEATAAGAMVRARQHDQMRWDGGGRTGSAAPPSFAVSMQGYSTDAGNEAMVNDPVYDALFEEFWTLTDPEETRLRLVELDRYGLVQHWRVQTFPTNNYNVYQPYLKGYSGELFSGPGLASGWLFARYWIDQGLQEYMGR